MIGSITGGDCVRLGGDIVDDSDELGDEDIRLASELNGIGAGSVWFCVLGEDSYIGVLEMRDGAPQGTTNNTTLALQMKESSFAVETWILGNSQPSDVEFRISVVAFDLK